MTDMRDCKRHLEEFYGPMSGWNIEKLRAALAFILNRSAQLEPRLTKEWLHKIRVELVKDEDLGTHDFWTANEAIKRFISAILAAAPLPQPETRETE
jgi:hypothetical protein